MSAAPTLKSFARVCAVALLMATLAPGAVFAWGETGHRVVCQIAYDELKPAARVELDRLLAQDPGMESFADACLYADNPERIRWQDHFMNVPRSTLAITVFDCPLAETCVLPAIRNDFLVVLNADASDMARVEAVKLLGHWVGDAHQPMHISFQDDRGANSIAVESEFVADVENANLHGVWDYVIIAESLGDDYVAIARELRQAITGRQRLAWRYDSPIEWVNESFQLTISATTGYCFHKQGACWYEPDNMLLDEGEVWRNLRIDTEYVQTHAPTVSLRLQQAGVRLAQLLNQSLIREKNE